MHEIAKYIKLQNALNKLFFTAPLAQIVARLACVTFLMWISMSKLKHSCKYGLAQNWSLQKTNV